MEERFASLLKRIDDATNGIASELRDLKSKITGAGLSADQEAEVLAALDSAAQKLEGIGAPDAAVGTADQAKSGT